MTFYHTISAQIAICIAMHYASQYMSQSTRLNQQIVLGTHFVLPILFIGREAYSNANHQLPWGLRSFEYIFWREIKR